jgi:hypothetical protein
MSSQDSRRGGHFRSEGLVRGGRRGIGSWLQKGRGLIQRGRGLAQVGGRIERRVLLEAHNAYRSVRSSSDRSREITKI